MVKNISIFYEGIFRRPRLWSNQELQKVGHLFRGSVVNVSGAMDLDKSVSNYFEYIFGDCNKGVRYEDYFTNAESYTITNYENDTKKQYINSIQLNLEKDVPEELYGSFDVVFCHTVLEHVYDIFKAFKNLCQMSNDIVIIVVPFLQPVHDFQCGYKDYWRFTPFSIEKLFNDNGFQVLIRKSNKMLFSSIYYLYIASKKPEKWGNIFPIKSLDEDLKNINTGMKTFLLSYCHYIFENYLRKTPQKLNKLIKRK